MNRVLKSDCNKFSKELNTITKKRMLDAYIPVGTIVDITFPESAAKNYSGVTHKDATTMILSGNGFTADGTPTKVSVRCRSLNWNKYFKLNGKMPTERTLYKWMEDGICKSLGGNSVEPDGWSMDNTPSWFLAMGLI